MNEVKVVFVNPLHSKEVLVVQQGTLGLATILKHAGYDVEIVDFKVLNTLNKIRLSQQGEEINTFVDYLISLTPDIIGFSCMSNCYHLYIRAAKLIKERKQNIKILFGGPQATETAKETLEAFPWIDVIALGESELTIVKIIEALASGNNYANVWGIAYKSGEKVIMNQTVELIENLDELPFVDYSLVPVLDRLNHVDIEVGRGCPFSCIYCSTKTFWKRKFRLKSVDRLIKEIQYLNTKYGIDSFGFVHDLFTLNRRYILEFCDRVISENLKIKWGCSARIDTIDETMIVKMKQAGCSTIYFGIETGSKKMQKVIKKNIDLDSFIEKLDIIVYYNLRATFSFIYGFPGESQEDLYDTLRIIQDIKKNKNVAVQLHKCSILAGTELYEQCKDSLDFCLDTTCVAGYLDPGSYDIVQNKSEIFPHFYRYNNNGNLEKYCDLDKFITYFHKFIVMSLPNLYRILIEYYKHDLLLMYQQIVEFDKDFFDKILTYTISTVASERKALASNELEYANLTASYIMQWQFGSYTKIIRDVFRYEWDIIKYKYLGINRNKYSYYNYDYDVIKIDNNSLYLEQIAYSPVKISITNDDKNIIIEKIIA